MSVNTRSVPCWYHFSRSHGHLESVQPQQRHRLDASDQVGEGRVLQQVLEGVAVGGGDQLHAPLGDRAGRQRFGLGADLVDHHHFRHVVLDRLDHHRVLRLGGRHLHPAGAADPRVGDVAVAGDLVRGVDHHHPLARLAQHARRLAQQGGLADAGTAQEQHRPPLLDDVAQHVDRLAPDPVASR